MKLAITICATENYCYAMRTLARRVGANLAAANWTSPGVLIIAGDNSRNVKDAVKDFKSALPKDWAIVHLACSEEDKTSANYKKPAQLVIAELRSHAFTAAREHHADLCWSLDSDTLPRANALRCMVDMIRFDGGYYSISTCPYPNDAFLGGFGTPQNPIAQDFLEHERVLPDELKAEIEALKKESSESKEPQPTPEWITRKQEVEKKVMECPPTGNIWRVIADHGWRRRGWFDFAYPAIGRGSIVPIDWCGFGCTLMNREALALADFDGYDGAGTEDLYIVWKRWYPAKLRLNCIAHCPADHVIWEKKKGGNPTNFVLNESYHEEHGECVGHLRTRKVPWRQF
jgi:hypothetical protein